MAKVRRKSSNDIDRQMNRMDAMIVKRTDVYDRLKMENPKWSEKRLTDETITAMDMDYNELSDKDKRISDRVHRYTEIADRYVRNMGKAQGFTDGHSHYNDVMVSRNAYMGANVG